VKRTSERVLPAGRQRLVGVLFLVTGAALVVHILVGLPLWLTVPGGLAAVATFLWWAGAFTGLDLRPVVVTGLVAGAAATLLYDLSRIAVVELFRLPVRPFAAWPLFGRALIGPAASSAAHWIAGVLFHLINGLAFAVAYTAWFGTRGVRAGIAWGLFLELFMLGLYPGWLNLSSYAPFLAMSLVGHVVYGAVLGAAAPVLLARRTARG
jgi:hypothetical protein